MKRAVQFVILSSAFFVVGYGRTSAAVVSFTDRPTWLAAVGPLSGTEDFSTFGSDTSFKSVSVPLNNMTVIGTTGSNGSSSQKIDVLPAEFSGIYLVDGTAYLLADLETSSEFTRFDFISPVTAWGTDTRGIANGIRDTQIEVYDAFDVLLGTVLTSSVDNSTFGFYGFQLTSGVADHVIFRQTTSSNDVFGLDNIGFVTAAIPEPTSLALLGMTAAGFCGVRIRRRRKEENADTTQAV